MKNISNYGSRRPGDTCSSSAGRQRSFTKSGSFIFVIGAVAGAGITLCIVKRKEIGNMLFSFMTSNSKASTSNNSSNKGRESKEDTCHTDSHTTSYVYAGHVNITTNNITNITINSDDNISKESACFSGSNYTEMSHEPSSECVADVSCPSGRQDSETVTPLSSVDSDFVQILSSVPPPRESIVVPSTSTFSLPLDANVINNMLFGGMSRRCFSETVGLELFTYVMRGRGEKPEGTIPIEWTASPRNFALFIGVVCGCRWSMAKKLFTGKGIIKANLSCCFSRLVSDGLVKGGKVAPGFENTEKFKREKDENLKFLLILLSRLP